MVAPKEPTSYRPPTRCCRVTSWSGRPRKTSEGQVPTQFAAEGTLDRDRLERELPDAGWNVAAAPFAGDDEGFAA